MNEWSTVEFTDVIFSISTVYFLDVEKYNNVPFGCLYEMYS